MFQGVFPFSINCLLKSFTILCETWKIKCQQMAKMNGPVPKERLGTSMLKPINFFSNLPAWPHLKILGIRSWLWLTNVTFMQSEIKVYNPEFWHTKKMWNHK